MTFGEFLDYEYGYEFRKAESWDETRNIMWASISAMGGNKQKPNEMIPIWIDKLGKKQKESEYLSDELVKKWVDSL